MGVFHSGTPQGQPFYASSNWMPELLMLVDRAGLSRVKGTGASRTCDPGGSISWPKKAKGRIHFPRLARALVGE